MSLSKSIRYFLAAYFFLMFAAFSLPAPATETQWHFLRGFQVTPQR